MSFNGLPNGVITNDESGVTLSNMTIGGTLTVSGDTIQDASGVIAFLGGNSGNVFAGTGAGNPAVFGTPGDNTGFGAGVLKHATSSSGFDTGVGASALSANTSGENNTALGAYALEYNTTGDDNTANGYAALSGNSNGIGNTAFGSYALLQSQSGNSNTAVGFEALGNLAGLIPGGGTNNIAIGCEAGNNFTENESSNIDIGNIGVNGENNIIRIGSSQTTAYIAGVLTGNGGGLTNLNAAQLTSIGNTNGGFDNFFVGPSGSATNSGDLNIGIGIGVLEYNNNGGGNTGIGIGVLEYNNNGGGNTGVGYAVLEYNNSGDDNTAVGNAVLHNNQNGEENTGIGTSVLQLNESGSFNTAVGSQALGECMNGGANTGVGYEVLEYNNSGSVNTAFGALALGRLAVYGDGQGNIANGGTNNIAIGYQAGYNFTANESSNIDIGNMGVAGENYIIRIGDPNVHTATYLAGTVYANGVALTSDRNAKENFKAVDAQAVLAKVAALPVTRWNYKTESKEVQHIGPMAQDFQSAFQLSADDKHISVVDEGGVALAAIQGLNQKLKEKEAEIQKLQQQVAALKAEQAQTRSEWATRFEALQRAVARIALEPAKPLAFNDESSREK